MKIKWTLLCAAVVFIIFTNDSTAKNHFQTELVSRLEGYLNNLKTLEASFLQTDEFGTAKTGTLYIKRPGKLRIEYDPPEKFLVIADGYYLIFLDLELGSPSYQNLEKTPAAFLLGKEFSFSENNFSIISLSEGSGVIEIDLKQTESMLGGELKLVFSDQPIELRQWKIDDPQNGLITITLLDMKSNLVLPDSLFEYEEENIFK